MCIKAIQTGMLPPTVGCKEHDPECDVSVTTDAPLERQINYAMTNLFRVRRPKFMRYNRQIQLNINTCRTTVGQGVFD